MRENCGESTPNAWKQNFLTVTMVSAVGDPDSRGKKSMRRWTESPLDREWAAREREQNAKRVAAPEMEMTGRGARTRRSAQTAGGPAVGADEDEDDGGAEIGTDGEFGEEEGRTYLLSREIGNELVKRAYLPDLEGRTPELHDEIAVTGWGENAWYTGTTNFIRAAGPRRLKSDSRHSLSRMGNGTFLISILRSTVQPR